VFQIRDNEPTPEFAQKYRQEAIAFFDIKAFRAKDLQDEKKKRTSSNTGRRWSR
jgi:sulfite reductase (ferredoxin)